MTQAFDQNNRGVEEAALLARGIARIAGVDEAGRGPLAGPVVAAAVIFTGTMPAGIDDSKKLSEKKRLALYDAITQSAEVGIAIIAPTTIDRLNIRGATLHGMAEALNSLPSPPDHVLIDGRDCPKAPWPMEALIKGDARSVSIAAASIIAKVTRDRIMIDLDSRYRRYGFAGHKGYPSPAHRAALQSHGPCPFHRRSYAPVKAALCPEDQR